MEVEIGLDGVFWCGCDELVHRRPDRIAARRVDARGGQCGRLAFDADAEVDHVEYVVMGADCRRLDCERRRLRHREHERSTALESFDEALGA